MKIKLYKFSIIVLFALLLLGCHSRKEKTTDSENATPQETDFIYLTQKQFEANGMKWGFPEERSFPETVHATGQIDVPPKNRQTVSSFYGGTVRTLNLLIGDRVRKGQVVATVENPEFIRLQKKYARLKSRLDYLKNEYERTETLYKENIASRKKFLLAQSEFRSALAEYHGLKKQLQLLGISLPDVENGIYKSTVPLYAGISGYVSHIYATKGKYVEAQDPVLDLINPEHIHVELNVFEKDALKIKKGQEVIFSFTQQPGKKYRAVVHLVGSELDPETRTVRVHAHPHDEHKNAFPVGMFVEADIITGNIKGPALPEEAFVEQDDHWYVLVLVKKEDDRFVLKPVEVEKGPTYQGYTLLKTPLDPKTRILTRGAYFLLGGDEGGHEH